MAKRRSTRKGNKIEPSVLTLAVSLPLTQAGNDSTSYVDLSQITSLMNRRFYRQGLNWAVAGFKFQSPPVLSTQSTKAQLFVSKLPNTWILSNSWEKSMRNWSKMNRDALDVAPSLRPKFLDFKVFADAGHHAAGIAANLMPTNVFGGIYNPGEWESSKFYIPVGDNVTPGTTHDFEIIATGPNYPGFGASGLDAVSMIEGYAASRGLPDIEDPNTPVDAQDAHGTQPSNWIAAVFNDGNDQITEVLEALTTENDTAPYPFENGPSGGGGTFTDTMYPGGANQVPGLELHDMSTIGGTTIGGTTRMKGGNFPCGLIRIDHYVHSESLGHSITLLIDMIPGNHRGYLCEPMTEM